MSKRKFVWLGKCKVGDYQQEVGEFMEFSASCKLDEGWSSAIVSYSI